MIAMKRKIIVIASIAAVIVASSALLAFTDKGGKEDAAKKAVMESSMIKAQSFYDELPDKLETAAVYNAKDVSRDTLFSLKSLDGIPDAGSQWYVDVDRSVEMTLTEKDGKFKVIGSSLPPQEGDQYVVTRMDPKDTNALLEKYSSDNGYDTVVVSIPQFLDTRLLLISSSDGMKAALVNGREDFCGMKLGEVIDFGDALSRLENGFPD